MNKPTTNKLSMKKSAPKTTAPKQAGHLPAVPFSIDAMDPLGQGVFKTDGHIGFIPKTLPGETGSAQLLQVKKGVRFARLKTLETVSPERIEPACPHYAECPGCHYLHTGYEQELVYKKQALQRLLHKLDLGESGIEVLAAPQRLGYRNRIQLHYRNGRIGLIDGVTDSIVEIPQCRILRDELQPELLRLYDDKTVLKSHGREGHCELYLKDGETSLQWNQPYSHGGFTQVFEAMNEALRAAVTEALQGHGSKSVLDLFAGDGNLSNDYKRIMADGKQPIRRVMVDSTPLPHREFLELDLFADDALKKFAKRSEEAHFDTLLLDPPRKGFPAINAWARACKPKHLVYVSCNPATLARDLLSIEGCVIEKVLLLDLFPGTYHFETLVVARIGKTKK